jgi:acyl-CoA thioesterase-2
MRREASPDPVPENGGPALDGRSQCTVRKKSRAATEADDPRRHLNTVLSIDEAGPDQYTGHCPAQAFDRVYGGQLAAQALLSAARTIRPGMVPVSAHTNFLRIGVAREPVTYAVERAADGRSLTSRVVHACQGERLLSVSVVSFQDAATEHQLVDHDEPAGPLPAPESLPTRAESMTERFGDSVTGQMAMSSWPVDVRYVDRTPWTEGTSPPRNRLWMRSLVGLPDDYLTHCAVLLYAADLHLPEPILFPSELSWYELANAIGVFGASLDYTVWFHRPFRIDDFLLHEQEAMAIANSRGLTTGRFRSRDGRLVASASELVGILRRTD